MLEDYSGTLISHKVVDEPISRNSIVNNTAVLSKGAFFTDSLKLVNANTNEPLVPNRDYKARVLDSAATGHAGGKEVHTLIEFNIELTSDLKAAYQYVGGRHVQQRETIINLLKDLEEINLNNIYFSQLKGRPHAWDVTEEHLHDASQVTGKDEEIAALSSIKGAIEALNQNIIFGPESELFIFISEKLSELVARSLDNQQRIEQIVEGDLGRDEAIIKIQTVIIPMLRKILNLELEQDEQREELTSLNLEQDRQDLLLAEQTLSIIQNQTHTIEMSHTQMQLSERIRMLENQ